MNVAEASLMREYYTRYSKIYRILGLSGLNRFSLKGKRIKQRDNNDIAYNVFIFIITNLCAVYLIYFAGITDKDIGVADIIGISYFCVFGNLMLFNITFEDKHNGYNIMRSFAEIDALLGIEESRFMRTKALKHYIAMCIAVFSTQTAVVTYLYAMFEVSIAIHVTGSFYFAWLIMCYNDFCFFLFNYMFLAMRVRYLNVALMKITRMNPEYVPSQLLFNSLYWKNEFDDKVMLSNLTVNMNFMLIFRKIYNHLQLVEKCYKFPLTLGVFTTIFGAFVSVQTVAIYIESSEPVPRAGVISSWSLGNWFFLVLLTMQIDMFSRQIEQTKLICAYAQLKPTNTGKIFKLTKSILRTLEVRSTSMSLFGMADVNTRLSLKLAASTLVYITVQLQLAFPQFNDKNNIDNGTAIVSNDPAT